MLIIKKHLRNGSNTMEREERVTVREQGGTEGEREGEGRSGGYRERERERERTCS